ncbi:MAG: iron chelate uptake ABC transporter family permease subunit, partial [Cetobacterium sp.]
MRSKISLILILTIVIVGIASLSLGSVPITIKQLFSINDAPDYIKIIIYDIRLPRIVMAILIGMMLSSSGVVVQAVFQNPLADPYI